MRSLFKDYLKAALTIYQSVKNLDLTFTNAIKTVVDYIQPMQCKLVKITEFDATNSPDWTFDYATGTMINATGSSKNLVTQTIVLNNFRLKKILLEGTSLSTAIVSYTTGTTLGTSTWATIASGTNADLDLFLTNIPTTGLRFRISNVDSVVTAAYLLFELE
jgi:hypothetical protein